MPDQPDPKVQKEFLDALKKMMEQAEIRIEPQPDKARAGDEDKTESQSRERLRFHLKPKEIKKYLDRFVIRQDEAKKVLATAICDHYNHISNCKGPGQCRDYTKQNILMLGPTGVGKTYLIRSASELIGVPFVKADATKFSETGYVGGDVEDLVRDLVHRAEGDLALAECGMIYLDEIDKIAGASNLQGRDVSGAGVQRGLLKIMEETEVSLRNPQDIQSQLQAMLEYQQKGKISRPSINTRHILFMVSGAFDRLPGIIERRQKAAPIGFKFSSTPEFQKQDLLRRARTEDFIEYGFEPEFIGRLPVRVVCDSLNAEDLYLILTSSEGSILKQYREAFQAYGIEMQTEDAALWAIAERAASEGTGARGLATICEKIFRDFKYELPSSRSKVFTLTPKMADFPKEALDHLLREERKERAQKVREEIRSFEENFFEKHGIRIEFQALAVESILAKVLEEGADTSALLEKLFLNYPYGLGLIQKRKPCGKFILTREAVSRPSTVLEGWIKEAYENKMPDSF